jgi:hypothetical protein
VRGDGAYEEEMNEVALFQRALRAAVPVEPDPRLRAHLVPRLARIARESSLGVGRVAGRTIARRAARGRPRIASVARVGIAAALLPLLIAGLAFAGVTVSDPARSAFDSVGVELPNQPADEGLGEANDRASEQGETSSSAGSEGKAAMEAKKAARGKSKGDDPTKPGRRVRRHGEGPPPGPASPPEGRALGLQNATGGSSTVGGSPGKAAFGRGQGALRGKGHSK